MCFISACSFPLTTLPLSFTLNVFKVCYIQFSRRKLHIKVRNYVLPLTGVLLYPFPWKNEMPNS